MPADNRNPLKLRFAKSALVATQGYECYLGPDQETSGVFIPKGGTPNPEQSTFCVSSSINISFGSCEITYIVANLGNAVHSLKKPLMVGVVDRTFTGFDGPITSANGWALSQDGTFIGRVQDGKDGGISNPKLAFESGDKVTFALKSGNTPGASVSAPAITVVVTNKNKAEKGRATFKVPVLSGSYTDAWLVPAVSLAASSANVAIEGVTDTTPLDYFAACLAERGGAGTVAGKEIGPAEANRDAGDALGPFWLRVLRRMEDSDVLRPKGLDPIMKADARLNCILMGHHAVSHASRAASVGIFETDTAQRHLQAFYNMSVLEVMSNPALFQKLRDRCNATLGRASSLVAQGAMPIGSLASVDPHVVMLAGVFQALEHERDALRKEMQAMVQEAVRNIPAASPSSPVLAGSGSPFGMLPQIGKTSASSSINGTTRDEHSSTARSTTTTTSSGRGGTKVNVLERSSDEPHPATPKTGGTSSHKPAPPKQETNTGGAMHRAASTAGNQALARKGSVAAGMTRRASVRVVAKPKISRAAAQEKQQQKKAEQQKKAVEKKATTSAQAASSPPATGNSLLSGVLRVRQQWQETRALGEKGSPTDADIANMQAMKIKLAKDKAVTAKEISMLPASAFSGPQLSAAREELNDLLQELTADGDHVEGNLELFQTILKRVPDDVCAEMCKEFDLASTAAYDGSLQYLKAILSLDAKLELDVADVAQNAIFNQRFRIQAVTLLLEYADKVDLASVAEEICDAWQEFFADVASEARANPKENRTGRVPLLTKMLQYRVIPIDMSLEGPDAQTVFSRAAKEGDTEVMTLCLTRGLQKPDVNRISSDSTTALIQAAVGNQVKAVKMLLSLPQTDAQVVSREGSAMFLAKSLKRSPEIVKMLEAAA